MAAAAAVARGAGRALRSPICCCWSVAGCRMSSSTSSSDPSGGGASSASPPARRRWRSRVVYAFVVLVDPFDTLPLSPPADRVPVATNARFSFPSLARSAKFDSAIFGTSTSRLLRPAILNAEFGARFANLAMNAATVVRAVAPAGGVPRGAPGGALRAGRAGRPPLRHRRHVREVHAAAVPRVDVRRQPLARLSARCSTCYAVQEAGQQFGILLGMKRQVYGSDGYTSFVPPDSEYDPARVAVHLRDGRSPASAAASAAARRRAGAFRRSTAWRPTCRGLPTDTRKILFFVPYNHWLMPPAGSPGARAVERVQAARGPLARARAERARGRFHAARARSPTSDDNYWDALHYRDRHRRPDRA